MKRILIMALVLVASCTGARELERNFVSYKDNFSQLDFTKKVIIQRVKDGNYPYHCLEDARKYGFIFFGETEFSNQRTFRWQDISDEDLHKLAEKKQADLALWFVFNDGYLVHHSREGSIANYVVYSSGKDHYLGFFFRKPTK